MTWPGPICVYSASGGQGTTTVVGAMAHFLSSSVDTVRHGFELTWGSALLARGRPGPNIRDVGPISTPSYEPGSRVAVVRGPSVEGAIRLAQLIGRFDEVVLIREEWRSTSISDLERAIRHPVNAIIPHSPHIARLADAGLLGTALPNLTEFAQLREWVDRYR